MTTPIIQLFVNPPRGLFARRRVAALRRAFDAAGATVLISESASGQLAVDPRADQVCAVGGDGTLRHVVAALHRSGRDIPVGVYPTGTVNLLAREHGYPCAATAFVRRVLGPHPRSMHHTGLVAGLPILTCASVGPDSYIVDRLSLRLKSRIGRLAYLAAFCRLIFHWRQPSLTLKWDGGTFKCQAAYIAKGRYFAGPWTFAPQARSIDAIFHVVALQRASRWDFVRFAWALLCHNPLASLRGVHSFSCSAVRIDGDPDIPMQADGDTVAHLPAILSLRSNPTIFA